MSTPGEERLNRTATPLRIGYDPGAEEPAPILVATPVPVDPAISRFIREGVTKATEVLEEDIAEAREMLAAEGFEAGDVVVVGEDGATRPIGVAMGEVMARLYGNFNFDFPTSSDVRDFLGYGSVHASMAMPWSGIRGWEGRQYQYTERFPPEVRDRAWKLLEQYMDAKQYFAFMEGADIELENLAENFRLLINKSGRFTILEGPRGSGIVAQSGRIKSYDYPLGDEIAAFIDWFNHRTEELIAQWNCGTYGIVKKGERR